MILSHPLAQAMADRIAAGLQRKSLTTCSRWACACRVMGGKSFPGPWSFKYHPWLKGMHDSDADLNIGQKSAQMGYTEAVLNIVFFNIDVNGVDCLYILPAKTPDASDFSSGRFDPALELSPHLTSLFSDVKNVGHKRAGSTNLYIRGSRSRAGLKSVPTGVIVLDELDEMTQENIPLALERASGQLEKLVWMVSTATIENYGINKFYLQSSQNHFHFKCPSCKRFIELKFPDSLIITGMDVDDPNVKNSHLICHECKATLEHKLKPEWLGNGIWTPSFTNRDSAGWYINQLYSSAVSPAELAKAYLQAQFDPAAEQEFYNSKLGVPHAVEGARVTDSQLEDARGSWKNGEAHPYSIVTMGVDVGKWCHYEIDEWVLPTPGTPVVDLNVMSRSKVIKFGKVVDFEALDELMYQYGVHFCVIDANPERRKAREFADRHHGRVKLCFYGRGVQGKTIHVSEAEPTLTVDRTSWLDLSLGRFRAKSIKIPLDFDMEYRTHLKALVRVYQKDPDDNPVGKYLKGNDDDHYAHARNYAEIALPLAVSMGQSTDIGSVF
jgi:hypothetical protein